MQQSISTHYPTRIKAEIYQLTIQLGSTQKSINSLHYAHHGMLVKFVLFLKKDLHYDLMILLFWDQDSIIKNISWGWREVLTFYKKNYRCSKLAWKNLPHHGMQMEIFIYFSKSSWVWFLLLSLIFSEVIVLVFSRKMFTYIFAWYKMYPRMLVWRTTECWSIHLHKHTIFEKAMTTWDSMVCFLKVARVVYIWTSFTWSMMI